MSNLDNITKQKKGKKDSGKIDFKSLNKDLENKKKLMQRGNVVFK